jgi:hypothetical protein
VFYIYLRTNSDLCHLYHKLIGFYNRDEKCLQLIVERTGYFVSECNGEVSVIGRAWPTGSCWFKGVGGIEWNVTYLLECR